MSHFLGRGRRRRLLWRRKDKYRRNGANCSENEKGRKPAGRKRQRTELSSSGFIFHRFGDRMTRTSFPNFDPSRGGMRSKMSPRGKKKQCTVGGRNGLGSVIFRLHSIVSSSFLSLLLVSQNEVSEKKKPNVTPRAFKGKVASTEEKSKLQTRYKMSPFSLSVCASFSQPRP